MQVPPKSTSPNESTACIGLGAGVRYAAGGLTRFLLGFGGYDETADSRGDTRGSTERCIKAAIAA